MEILGEQLWCHLTHHNWISEVHFVLFQSSLQTSSRIVIASIPLPIVFHIVLIAIPETEVDRTDEEDPESGDISKI